MGETLLVACCCWTQSPPPSSAPRRMRRREEEKAGEAGGAGTSGRGEAAGPAGPLSPCRRPPKSRSRTLCQSKQIVVPTPLSIKITVRSTKHPTSAAYTRPHPCPPFCNLGIAAGIISATTTTMAPRGAHRRHRHAVALIAVALVASVLTLAADAHRLSGATGQPGSGEGWGMGLGARRFLEWFFLRAPGIPTGRNRPRPLHSDQI